jgi:hypothetical protein
MSTQEHLSKILGISSSHTEDKLNRTERVKRRTGGRMEKKSGGSTTRVGYQMPRKGGATTENREPHFLGGLARGLGNMVKTGAKMAGKALSNPETRGKLISAGKHLYGAAKSGGAKGVATAAMNAVKDEGTRNKMISTAKDIHRDATAKKGGSIKRSCHAMGGAGKMRKGQYE